MSIHNKIHGKLQKPIFCVKWFKNKQRLLDTEHDLCLNEHKLSIHSPNVQALFYYNNLNSKKTKRIFANDKRIVFKKPVWISEC